MPSALAERALAQPPSAATEPRAGVRDPMQHALGVERVREARAAGDRMLAAPTRIRFHCPLAQLDRQYKIPSWPGLARAWHPRVRRNDTLSSRPRRSRGGRASIWPTAAEAVMGLDEGLAGKRAALGLLGLVHDRGHVLRRHRDIGLGPDLTFVIRIFAGPHRHELVGHGIAGVAVRKSALPE